MLFISSDAIKAWNSCLRSIMSIFPTEKLRCREGSQLAKVAVGMLQIPDLQVLIKKTIISSPFLTGKTKAHFSLAIFMSLCLISSLNCYLTVILFLNCEMLIYSALFNYELQGICHYCLCFCFLILFHPPNGYHFLSF